ncbi:MAG: 2-polyprenylphenol 6-hydroxylase [Rhodospirillales bacterium]|nr:2-polyprenylphenol 6-hydroxylase [Rhodospirillales bacterium]
MIRSLRNIRRLLKVARTLARYDALFLLERLDVAPGVVLAAKLLPAFRSRSIAKLRPGQRLAKALETLGPTMIKLGQALSTRSDLLGEEMAADLSELQDRLAPFPGHQARAIIEKDLGAPIDSLFSEFEDQAVAAASIAQVHFATTVEGEEVAVKVLRPHVKDSFRRDFDMFYWAAELLERAKPELMRLKPVETVRALEESVQLEMDLRFEAAAAAEIAENFAGDPDIHIPTIDWPRTAQSVMTMERISGTPIDERDALTAAGHDPIDVITKCAGLFFKMVFRDGFFHGDLHPGNLFVRDDGTIIAVDFGIMGRVDKKTRRHLAEMLIAFLTKNYRRAAEVHFEAGWVPAHKSVDAFTQASRSIAEPILGLPQDQISMARLLAQLFQVTEYFDMETQPQLLQLQKTMLLIEGTGRTLSPQANMWQLAEPLIEEWFMENMGPQARIRDAAEDFTTNLQRLPIVLAGLEANLGDMAQGGLKLHPETLEAMASKKNSNGNDRLLWAGIIAAITISVVSLIAS